jgi:hypothetical protein
MTEKNVLDGKKILILIKDLNGLGINMHQRRDLISASFSFCGRIQGKDVRLREEIQSAYSENLGGKYAFEKIEEAIKVKKDKHSIEMLSRQKYGNNYFDF